MVPFEHVQKLVEHYLDFWQKRVFLQDWKITIQVVHQYEVSGQAETLCSLNYKEARIKIAHPEEINPAHFAEPLNLENSVLHELIHLHLFALETVKSKEYGTLEYAALEQAVNYMTRALLSAMYDQPPTDAVLDVPPLQ